MGNWISITNKITNNFPITCRKSKKYGWIPDHRDIRDKYYNMIYKEYPNSTIIKRRIKIFDIPNEYNLKASVTCSVISVYLYSIFNNNLSSVEYNILFHYFNERLIRDTQNYDSGSSIRDSLKILNKIGTCKYNDYINPTKPPDINIYNNLIKPYNISYKRIVHEKNNILSALYNKLPIIFGYSIYESFEDSDGVCKTGIVNMPNITEKLIGGNCGIIIGYDNEREKFLVVNHFGNKWGEDGMCWMPYEYILNKNLCDDFWIIDNITDNNDIIDNNDITKVPFNILNTTNIDMMNGYQIRDDDLESDLESDLD